MFDFNNTGPAPADLATRRVFEKVRVPLVRLAETLDANGETLRGRRFVDCIIEGPAVAIQTDETRIHNCNLGDVGGDVRNLFLRTTGPMVIGGISLNDCVFEGCLFMGVGFAGTDEYVESMLKLLQSGGA